MFYFIRSSPGVYWLQDPRSGVYNFTTWLESIPNVKDFAFDRVTGFIRSSGDEVCIRCTFIIIHIAKTNISQDLWTLARRENRKYTGSTSSLTGMLSHIYFLISDDKDVDVSSLSRHFHQEVRHVAFIPFIRWSSWCSQARNFTPGQRMPTAVNMNYRDGVYAFDSASSDLSQKNVLTWMVCRSLPNTFSHSLLTSLTTRVLC